MAKSACEVAFYHLSRSTLEQTLGQLLQKTIDTGKRAVVMTGSAERAEGIAASLWESDPASWLPHGADADGCAESQPIWITEKDENPNGAHFLFLGDGASSSSVGDYERCFEIFDGHDEAALKLAREKWKSYKGGDIQLTYWQQTDSGGWEKKEV